MENEQKPKKSFWGDKRFLSANIALVLGILAILSGVGSQTSGGAYEGAGEMGWILVIGSFALKSAKKRSLGLVQSTNTRKVLEIVGVLGSLGVLYLYNQFAGLQNIIAHPLPIVAAVFILTSYLVIVYKNFFGEDKKKRLILGSACFLLLFFAIFYSLYFLNTSRGQGSGDSWGLYTAQNSSFSVLLPSQPKYEQKNYEAGVDSQISYTQDLWTADMGSAQYTIESFEIPQTAFDFSSPQANQVLSALAEGSIKKIEGATVTSKTDSTFRSYPAVDVEGGNSSIAVKGRFFNVGQKVFGIFVLYRKELPISDSEYSRFVDSFRL